MSIPIHNPYVFQPNPMDPIRTIRGSSIPLPGGGDTHFDVWGPRETDFVVTTRLPGCPGIHDGPFQNYNPNSPNYW